MTYSQGPITVDLVRKALHGAAIYNNGDLYAQHEGHIPQEFIDAAVLIKENFAEFKDLLWERLKSTPLLKSIFGDLIRARLKQKGYLASPLVSIVFDDYQQIERRLSIIQEIPGVENLKREYRPSNDPASGQQTDESARDLLAEILILYFLKNNGFGEIRKLPSDRSKPHVDVIAEKDNKVFAIDVTRKKELSGLEPLPFSTLEDCNDPSNHDKIRGLLIKALASKNDQFSRVINLGELSDKVIKVVAIKPSDYGFAECINQAQKITENLLAETDNWEYIDAVWLIPTVDVGQSKWIFKR